MPAWRKWAATVQQSTTNEFRYRVWTSRPDPVSHARLLARRGGINIHVRAGINLVPPDMTNRLERGIKGAEPLGQAPTLPLNLPPQNRTSIGFRLVDAAEAVVAVIYFALPLVPLVQLRFFLSLSSATGCLRRVVSYLDLAAQLSGPSTKFLPQLRQHFRKDQSLLT